MGKTHRVLKNCTCGAPFRSIAAGECCIGAVIVSGVKGAVKMSVYERTDNERERG